jgi:phage tail sheath protein FI
MAVRKLSTPGVYRQEIDQSDVNAPAGTSTGGIVIRSQRGPINRPVLVTSDKDLIDIFGKPVFTSGATGVKAANDSTAINAAGLSLIPDNGYGIYAALEFLKESNALYVGRIAAATDKYAALSIKKANYNYTASTGLSATSGYGVASVMIGASDQFDMGDNISTIESDSGWQTYAVATGVSGDFLISSLSPGIDGNNVAVSVETFSSGCDWLYKYDGVSLSGTSATSVATQPIESKIVRIDVYTKDTAANWDTIKYDIQQKQAASSTSASDLRALYSPVETFYGTIEDKIDGSGKQLKLSTVINGSSKYIYVKDGAPAVTSFGTVSYSNYSLMKYFDLLPLGGGAVNSTGTGLGTSDSVTSTWDLFASREKLPGVNILINPDWSTAVKVKVAQIAANRMDCIAVGQVADPSVTTVANTKSAESYGYVNPSYMALYAGYDKLYDQYNDKFYYMPKAVFGACVMARVDRIGNTWDAPAGVNRGILPSYSQKVVFTDAEIGQLYDLNINTSKSMIGIGSVLWGQKTAQLKKSALDRINVRRLLVYLENSIEPTLQQFLFELNTDRTRQRITSIVDSFLNGVQSAGGLTGFKVVCDGSNNTSDVIDNNQLFCDIYVQPSRAIEFITLRTIITRTGVTITQI